MNICIVETVGGICVGIAVGADGMHHGRGAGPDACRARQY